MENFLLDKRLLKNWVVSSFYVAKNMRARLQKMFKLTSVQNDVTLFCLLTLFIRIVGLIFIFSANRTGVSGTRLIELSEIGHRVMRIMKLKRFPNMGNWENFHHVTPR